MQISGLGNSNQLSIIDRIGSGEKKEAVEGDIFDMLLASLTGTNISVGNDSGSSLMQSIENTNPDNSRGIIV